MTAVAGLNLAANIFEMVQYGAQFLATAYKIYQSGNDAIENFSSLQVLSKNLEDVSQRLAARNTQASASQPDGAQIGTVGGLAGLSRECNKTTQEMLRILDKVGLPKKVKARKRDALRFAFKAS